MTMYGDIKCDHACSVAQKSVARIFRGHQTSFDTNPGKKAIRKI